MGIKATEKATPLGKRVSVECTTCGKNIGSLSSWEARFDDKQTMLEYITARHHC